MKRLLLILSLFASVSVIAQSDSVVVVFESAPFPYQEYTFEETTWIGPDGKVILDLDRSQVPAFGYSSPHYNGEGRWFNFKGNKYLLEVGTLLIIDLFNRQGDNIDSYSAYVVREEGKLTLRVVEESDRVGYRLYESMTDYLDL